jgi:cyclin-dependent kinase regulatory subunit CKS1
MPTLPEEVEYSDKYYDDFYEYRHVILTMELYQKLPKQRLLTEIEWR